ncbi:MAG: hypothetical protein LBE92_20405 [Chryseobacterium sp.]|jgi:hypothetical protein|nr:hypothetical protein [Chryseobacterium sp.]MDR2238497.1 hypothetical protein [Chryseobacterium sp.]
MDQEWKARTSAPIGMNDYGDFFPVDAVPQPKEPDQPTPSRPWWKIW